MPSMAEKRVSTGVAPHQYKKKLVYLSQTILIRPSGGNHLLYMGIHFEGHLYTTIPYMYKPQPDILLLKWYVTHAIPHQATHTHTH